MSNYLSKSSLAFLDPILKAGRLLLSLEGRKGQKICHVRTPATPQELVLLDEVLQLFRKSFLVAPKQFGMDGVELAIDLGGLDVGGIFFVADQVEVSAEESEKIRFASDDAGCQGRPDAFEIAAD